MKSFNDTFQHYISQHSVSVIANEGAAVCSRKFIVERFYCSYGGQIGIGTIWGINLPASLAFGVLINRTLVLDAEMSHCGGLVSLQPWIVTPAFLQMRLNMHDCPKNLNLRAPQHKVYEHNFKCYLDQLEEQPTLRIIWNWYTPYHLFNRTEDLFNHTEGYQLRPAQRLLYHNLYNSFDNAILRRYSYPNGTLTDGLLINAALEFSPHITNLTQSSSFGDGPRDGSGDHSIGYHKALSLSTKFQSPAVSNISSSSHDSGVSSVLLGIHVRHQDKAYREYSRTIDKNSFACVERTLLHQYGEGRCCLLLLATDRLETVHYFQSRESELGCKVLTLALASTSNKTLSSPSKHEHGPWEGVQSIVDVYALSRADVFFASHVSSFSRLAHALFLAHHYRSGAREAPAYKTLTHAGRQDQCSLLVGPIEQFVESDPTPCLATEQPAEHLH